MDIHFFEDAEGWAVHADGTTRRFASRREAFAEAGRLARANAPATVVRGAPGTSSGGAEGDVAATDPGHPDVPVRRPATGPRDRSSAHDGLLPPGRPAAPSSTTATRPAGGGRGEAGERGARPGGAEGGPGVSLPEARSPRRTGDGPVDWARLAGPAALGRSLLVAPGGEVPAPWQGSHRVDLAAEAGTPGFLERVRTAYLERTPTVYELPPDARPPVESLARVDVWALAPDFELEGEAAWYLLVANAVDARVPEAPVWPWADAAVAAGATPAGSDAGSVTGDVVLPDGRAAWCDGGPLRFWAEGELGDGAAVVLPRVAVERGTLRVPGQDAPSADLAPDQLAAVAEPTGRSRIVAPAGSGKTRVLVERARHLLAVREVPSEALCLVAFNKRAQLEMAERTPDLPGLQVQTLNALALAVLNGGRGFRDRGERVRTIDELAVRRILDELVTFPRRANTDPAAAWLDALSAVRLGLSDPAEVEADFSGDVDGFAEVFGRYRRVLRDQGAVDFDDQIYRAIEVLLAEPATRRRARQVCRLLLVDEFQDLTPAHLLLVRLLAGPDLDVFGVGDDDQTIYGYTGASPDWLVRYDRWFPHATHHALEVNYRCPVPVVAAATNLLSHNRRRVPKVIVPGPDAATGDGTLRVATHADPTTATVEHVAELLASGAAPAEVAVLGRVNTLLAPVQVALHERGIPAANREGTRFLDRTGVAAALAWLALATGGPFASSAIERAARRPGRGLSPRLIGWMAEQRDVTGLTRLAERLTNERDAEKVLGFAGDLERITRKARRASTAELVEHVRSELGLDRTLQTLDAAHRGRNATAHADDLRALVSLGRLHPDARDFGGWLRRALEHPPDPDGVQLATVHRVKGLEWPHVVVHDATDGVVPHHLSTDVEEERRVFHVAITRGQRSVLVVADAARPSIFLDELTEPAPARPVDDEAATDDRRDGRGAGPRRGATARTGGGERAGGAASGPDRGTGTRGGRGPAEVPATVGLAVSWGGYDATVAEVGEDGVRLDTGRASVSVAFGSTVRVEGRDARLVPPPTGRSGRGGRAAVDATDADQGLLEVLKAWRRERSKRDGVPAYVVAPDATLVEIATVLPRSDAELLRVGGIGPAKLERYGDEILAIVDDQRPPGT